MEEETFKDFKRLYENRLEEDEVIRLLLNNEIRNYIIENDNFNFLALIASSNSDKLRAFYFNEQTIPYIVQLEKFSGILFRSDFFPNKIKLFDNNLFLKSLTLKDNTYHTVKHIKEEFEDQSNNSDLINILKDGLYKFMDYLQQDFESNIKNISIFMKELPSELYKEFLDYILDNLKQVAVKNEEIELDGIFSNPFIKYGNISFEEVETIINKFNGIPTLYYSPSLIYSLIGKSVSSKGGIINKQDLNRLKDYMLNDYCKKIFLMNLDYTSLEKLYMCFSHEIIDYLLDDNGLIILENNNKFYELLSSNIPYDKLTESKIFASFLSKNYPNFQDYDNRVNKVAKSFSSTESFFNLLNSYIELNSYSYFFRVFTKLSSADQMVYFKSNFPQLLMLNNSEIFKGMKKEVYEVFKDRIDIKNWTFSDYDLNAILNDKQNYSEEQLKCIFSNKENIFTIINGNYIENTYEMILNLNNPKLNLIYMGEEFLSALTNLNKLDKIYKIINKLEIDINPLLLNVNCLIDIGKKVEKEYKKRSHNKLLGCDINNTYPYFLLEIPKLEDSNALFKILDFYLTNSKYLSTFYILRNGLKNEVLQEYLISRKNLITKIIQENNCRSNLILENLPNNIRKNEIFKERENVIIHIDILDYYRLFHDDFEGKYRLDEKILNDNRFIEKFINYYGDVEKLLRLVTTNDELIKRLIAKVKIYTNMRKRLLNSLNDSENEFRTYLEILINSNVDVYEIEFLKDMIECIFFNEHIKESFFKYKNKNLEKMKLNILSNVIKSSQESIVASVTNPLDKSIVYTDYMLNDEKFLIPTITYDNENYTFLVRRMNSGEHLYDGTYQDRVGYYSIITEKNRSMYDGNSGIKFGYANINSEDIIQINSFDAISKNSYGDKYIEPYIKYPEWVCMEELNKRTLESRSYNELRIKGKYIPEFVISYDEPNEATLKYSHDHNTPMVKILRKSYKSAIEQCKDPYSHWH